MKILRVIVSLYLWVGVVYGFVWVLDVAIGPPYMLPNFHHSP